LKIIAGAPSLAGNGPFAFGRRFSAHSAMLFAFGLEALPKTKILVATLPPNFQ
jgi:hypothetical protein